MTDRLYYDNSELLEFDAVVTKTRTDGKCCLAALNRSAFYPTSGGQPYDTGTLNGIPVLDVFVDEDGEVWHQTQCELAAGDKVHGSIDAERRHDHMQQHAADHMIAGTLYELYDATTIGLHISDTVSSIDVQFADGTTRLDESSIARVEDIVNERIRANGEIRCWFPDTEELASLPLRKKPTVKEHIRIVAIGDYEMVACGGTHPAHTGEIGLVKILEVAPARGKARVTFVAGKRAFENYRSCFRNVHAAAGILTTHPDNLPEIVNQLQSNLKETQKRLKYIQAEMLRGKLDNMISKAEQRSDGVRIVKASFETDASLLKDLAANAIRQSGIIVLLAAHSEKGTNYVFARSADTADDMPQIMRQSGARGGGKKDFAQGSGPDGVLEEALQIVLRS